MGRYALPRRRTAVAISSVVLVLAGGAVLPTPAVAAPVAPWTTATAITDGEAGNAVKDLVTTADGSAVAVWKEPGDSDVRLYAAVRPSGDDTWGAPALLATTPTGNAESVRLHASADGTVTALWMEYPDEIPPNYGPIDARVVSSVLAADHSGWSTPVELVGTDQAYNDGGVDLAEAPDGTLTAVWGTGTEPPGDSFEVFAATRGADGTWSAPTQVSDAADRDQAYHPSVAVTSDGTVVVAYWQGAFGSASSVLRTVSLAADATTWTAPATLPDSVDLVGHPELTAGPDGTTVLAWKGSPRSYGSSTVLTAVRSADGTWSAPETVGSASNLADVPEPLVAPDGDVTLVWKKGTLSVNGAVASTTRDSATGTWSALRTVQTPNLVHLDAAISADGTVHTLWDQAVDGKQVLMESARSDGKWTTPTQLPGWSGAYPLLQISAGDDGHATAVWSGAPSSDVNRRLYVSRTAWPALAVTGSTVPATAALRGTTATSKAWTPTWTLSRPTSSWSLTLTDTAGRTVRTLTGSTADLKVAASWNGRTTSGSYAPNGPLTWTLRATQQGAASAVTLASGKVTVTGGAAVPRDFGGTAGTPDGTGDLLTLNSSGVLTFQLGKRSTGTFSGKVSGSGWAPSVKAIPFGDLSGDRCNDVLVRLSSGALRAYKPGCGKSVTPSTASTGLGAGGWNQYNVLTSPGDVSGDSRPDLIARNSSTGAVYLYKGTSTGKLSARVKLYDNWKTYKKIVGAGDLNGDGIGDLLAQDKSNNLYRYDGKGNGTFKARVKLFTEWGGSYNAVVGVGDITGDGKADLVSRDSSGNVWRNNGNGKGSFGGRTKIATGWGGYKSVS